jgi:hypothetical protein
LTTPSISLNVSSYWPCEWCADADHVSNTTEAAVRHELNRT